MQRFVELPCVYLTFNVSYCFFLFVGEVQALIHLILLSQCQNIPVSQHATFRIGALGISNVQRFVLLLSVYTCTDEAQALMIQILLSQR